MNIMKISTGMSVINLPSLKGNKIESEKIYFWPFYNAGKVNKVDSISRREYTPQYVNPLSEESNEKLKGLQDQRDILYTSQGSTYNNPVFHPSGSLFSVLV